MLAFQNLVPLKDLFTLHETRQAGSPGDDSTSLSLCNCASLQGIMDVRAAAAALCDNK